VTDRPRLYAAALLRAFATGQVAILVGLYLARRGFDAAATGSVVSAGLAGAAAAAALVTARGDRFGRRRTLVALSVLGTAGGVVVAFASAPWLLAVAAFFGMLNGMGRDRGAALILDQAILPATGRETDRTTAFAAYNVLQDVGHALGALAAGAPLLLGHALGVDDVTALRLGLGLYAALLATSGILYAGLSPQSEASPGQSRERLSPATRSRLLRICSLFALDSLAGGFLTAALLAVYFEERYGASATTIGSLFFGARVGNALSHLGAAWLARRIGLLNTMVFTHIPSSLLLVTMAFAPSFPVAALLFLLREGLVEMDVPTRQSYVMGVVRPEERTMASGLTQLVRLAAWAVAPAFAGLLMRDASLATPLVVGGLLKIAYDLALYFSFRGLRPPEERTELRGQPNGTTGAGRETDSPTAGNVNGT
jgi:MFS family permease